MDFGWFRPDFDGFWMVFLDGFRLALDGFRLDFGWIFGMDLEWILDGLRMHLGWI